MADLIVLDPTVDFLGLAKQAKLAPKVDDLNGKVLGMIEGSGQGKTLGRYGEAHYIAVSARDEVFVADTLNWRVQKYVRK